MIGIKGPRGAGKTTLMLQHLKFDLRMNPLAMYITADHTWFYNHTLLETASNWYKQGGKILFIDEVHKYPNWSVELKNIYDGFPGLQVVFSASSALDIYRGEADLSRRVVSYSLAGLSFREFLFFTTGKHFNQVNFDDIPNSHMELSRGITENFHPLPDFHKYLQVGYLPIIIEGEDTYLMKLGQVINTIVDTDLAYIASYNPGTATKVKKLLGVIAESVPFKPNIAALARKLDLSRDSVYQYIYQLRNARLLNTLSSKGKGVSILQKPDKVFLENSNLAYTLTEEPDIGNIRETFALNQLLNAGLDVNIPGEGDFAVNNMVIEVGGKGKNTSQVKHLSDYLIASDNIEVGAGSKIPLWLLGFLY
ncbi:ATPase component BioM of energizing module of biotin ECF transporter [hydrothermal vent metagenome]|uniref:ATPase component BioM of energizing module of biotin ECF transporter n=1 Tax=hydrothermal vent metagenome TaxID=652676 RepID=A0A3B0TRN5_9ZZZZ